jgi:hypothetical protein
LFGPGALFFDLPNLRAGDLAFSIAQEADLLCGFSKNVSKRGIPRNFRLYLWAEACLSSVKQERIKHVQMKEVIKLRKAWGDKPCDHPNFEKEYDLGAQTGDYVCTTCGYAIWAENRSQLEKNQQEIRGQKSN